MKNPILLKEAIQTYLAKLRKEGKNERTLYTYHMDLKQVMAFFGPDRMLNTILLPQVGKFFKSDALLLLPGGKERSTRTVSKTLRVFRMFMIWAHQIGHIETLPLPRMTPMGRTRLNSAGDPLKFQRQ